MSPKSLPSRFYASLFLTRYIWILRCEKADEWRDPLSQSIQHKTTRNMTAIVRRNLNHQATDLQWL